MRAAAVSSLNHALLGPPGRQRTYVAQTLLALILYVLFGFMQHGEVLLGLIDRDASNRLTALYVGGATVFYALVRSGLSQRLVDHESLTLAQSGFAFVVIGGSYAITGPARGAVMTLLVLILSFAMFTLRPAQARRLALFGFAVLACVMLWKSRSDPQRYPAQVELVHAVWAAIVLGGVTVLAGRMGVMRSRLKAQKAELRLALAQISQLATRDELTGLVNRRHMGTLLREHQDSRRERAAPMTIALIDIDLFKRINDSHGHQAGDQVLKAFATASREVLRANDVLARWGGEEFLLMLPDTTLEQAARSVERMRVHLAQTSFDDIAAGMKVTFSAGLSDCEQGLPLDACIERADQAMYRAKTQGRDCIVTA